MTAEGAVVPAAAGDGFAGRRLYRMLSLALSLTSLIELMAAWRRILAQIPTLSLGFSALAVAMILVPALASLSMFWWARIGVLRWIWRGQALGMLAVYVMLPLTLGERRIPSADGLTWLSELEILTGVSAALGWRLRGTIAFVLVWQGVMLATAVFWGADEGHAMSDATRQLFFMATFVGLSSVLLRAGEHLDETVDAVAAEAAARAGSGARRAARKRVDMLVHDSVIVALLSYAFGVDARRTAAQAGRALHAIRSQPGADHLGPPPAPRDLAWRLQALTTELAPAACFSYTDAGETPIPLEVADALAESLAEALRNSLRHADRDASVGDPAGTEHRVTRMVHVAAASDRVDVVVLDDGVGFEPQTISAARFGIRHGILQRMRSLTGGEADVRSRPDHGTVVSLVWARP